MAKVSTKKTETQEVSSEIASGAITETRDIEIIAEEIQFYKRQAGQSIIEIGIRLNEAKAQLEHGEWTEWLKKRVDFSERSAQRFMRLALEYKTATVTDLGAGKALALLALPPEERDEFIEETHDVGGEEKSVKDMSKRELEKAVKERAEAIKARDAAEQIAKETEEEIQALKQQLENANLEASRAQGVAEAAKNDARTLEAQLEELKNADTTLPDEEGQQMMESMRKEIAAEAKKEAEAKLKKKIDKADAEKAEAEIKLKEAEDTAARLTKEAENVKRQAEEKVEKLQKQLKAASSEHITIFKTHFANSQTCINSMLECIENLKDAPEMQDKLKTALRTLCETTLKGLPEDSGEN
ncbi:MAG: DUF3102 domain-containing protein [Oscillospiraceae bacterium]|nr:DUF3102 domain-containing protein [Oscillospiraceae bacterium]